MATAVDNTTGSTGSSEFAGDEFSNNLFSDLAPLLTLFGEQVTKQFLSMSMGWADNILLAMGPLGIMTVIVSAIRVGGVKKLKAIVGRLKWRRARESQSDAEQELLSSTSENVCEMWSGQQIVRMIGGSEGMKNLIITKDGGVFDIATGLGENLIESHEFNSRLLLQETAYLETLRDAAPNLALNLWCWAAFGILLQALALAFPGVTTYYWKWDKAGDAVPNYGYPCFFLGTVAGKDRGLRIVKIQKACTVSDQHFSSYALFNEKDNQSIRTSRLNTKDYSSLAAISTSVAVVGFVVQFVGLRALHWSATILQLGVTLIMTGVQAWARRGLASDPETMPVMEKHDPRDPLQHPIPHAEMFTVQQLFAPIQPKTPLGVTLERNPSIGNEDTLNTFTEIEKLLSGNSDITQLSKNLSTIVEGVMKVLCSIDAVVWEEDGIQMPQFDPERPPSYNRVEYLTWGFNVKSGRLRDYHDLEGTQEPLSFRLRTLTTGEDGYDVKDPNRWKLDNRNLINAVLSLWLYTLAVRQEYIAVANEVYRTTTRESVVQDRTTFGRIVGNERNRPKYRDHASLLEEWLGVEVFPRHCPDGLRDFRSDSTFKVVPFCFFGMFLSSLSEPEDRESDEGSDSSETELFIPLPSDSGLPLQCAQELFSLFILAIASNIEKVLGTTTYEREGADLDREMSRKVRRWDNSVFSMIANEVVNGGLARDVAEAYTLIVPAFARYGILPSLEDLPLDTEEL
ncbi:hypothetical protein EDB80DRAFT_842607 [Ilyonectria destructans]|nr:hypothetical protein EDB80DRAFT_842607 [Ilyonectria destructans]